MPAPMYSIVRLTENTREQWNKFCLESDDACFSHTTSFLEYGVQYHPVLRTKNLSFMVFEREVLKAAVPLLLELHQIDGEMKEVLKFSFSGSFGAIPAPALINNLGKKEHRSERELLLEFIFKEIDRLADKLGVIAASFCIAPSTPNLLNKNILFNFLVKYNFLDISAGSQIVDSTISEDILWDNIRYSHKNNIKKNKDLEIFFFTKKNITRAVFNSYKTTHHKAAGRKTRPDVTFEMMYDWILDEKAFLAVVKLGEKAIGFEYFTVYKKIVESFSAANDPEFKKMPIRHFLLWQAILWMKQQGFVFFNVGLQQFGCALHFCPDQKELNIFHFKKGFGGFLEPYFIGEKFYNKNYFLELYKNKIEKTANYLFSRE